MPFMEGMPTVVVTLDKPRTLGFTMGSVRRVMEEKQKRNISEDAPEALSLPIDIWACLAAEDRAELSIEQIEEMIHLGNIKAVSTAFAELMKVSNRELEKDADAPDPTQAGPRLAASG